MAALASVVMSTFFVILLYGSGLFSVCCAIPIYALMVKGFYTRALVVSVAAMAAFVVMGQELLPILTQPGAPTWLRFLPLPSPEWIAVWGGTWSQWWGLSSLGFFLSVGICLGVGVRHHWQAGRLILFPVLVGGLLFLLALSFGNHFAPQYLGQGLGSFVNDRLLVMLAKIVEINKASGVPPEQLTLLETHAAQVVETMIQLVPVAAWLTGLLVVSVTLFGGKWFIDRAIWMPYQGAMTRWKSSSMYVWLTIASGIVYFLNVYVFHDAMVSIVVVNGLLAMAGIFLLQGALIVSYYVRRQRGNLMRWAIYGMLIVFFQAGLFVMTVLGLLDYWADFRKLERKITL